MKKTILFIFALALFQVGALCQITKPVDVKDNYTKPAFQGNIRIQDSCGATFILTDTIEFSDGTKQTTAAFNVWDTTNAAYLTPLNPVRAVNSDSGYYSQGNRWLYNEINADTLSMYINNTGFDIPAAKKHNYFIGWNAGTSATGENKTVFGDYSGGYSSGSNLTAIGFEAGYNNDGNNTVNFGTYAGHDNTGNNSIFLGDSAGMSNGTNGALFIGSGDSSTALIYGHLHSKKRIRINGQLYIHQPATDATPDSLGSFVNGQLKATSTSKVNFWSDNNTTLTPSNARFINTDSGYYFGGYKYFVIDYNREVYNLGYDAGAKFGTASNSQTINLGYNAAHNTTHNENSVNIGVNAAASGDTVSRSVILGYSSFNQGRQATNSVIIGNAVATQSKKINECVIIGNQAGDLQTSTTTKSYNIFIGSNTGAYNSGINNICFGYNSGHHLSGSSVIALGRLSGYYNTSNNSLFLGDSAGMNNSINGALFIGSGDSTHALIYGHLHSKKRVRINGQLYLHKTYADGTHDSTLTIADGQVKSALTSSLSVGNSTLFNNLNDTGFVKTTSNQSIYGNKTFLKSARTGFGQASPTAWVHLGAQTATAGTAPLKFTSGGALISVAEAGTMEYDGSKYYVTSGTAARIFTWGETSSGSATNGSVWLGSNAATPSTTNYTIKTGSTQTNLNATSTLVLSISNTQYFGMNTTVANFSSGVKLSVGGLTAPSYDFSLAGTAARTIGMERHSTADNAGNNLTILAGGATTGATNKSGGIMYLKPGIATGSGMASVRIYRNARDAASTTDNAQADALLVMSEKTLVDATETGLFDVACPAGAMISGAFHFGVTATDGTELQSEAGEVYYTAVNKGGAYTTHIKIEAGASGSHAETSGTLTTTADIVTGSNKITVRIKSDSSLTTPTIKCYYNLNNNCTQAVTQL